MEERNIYTSILILTFLTIFYDSKLEIKMLDLFID